MRKYNQEIKEPHIIEEIIQNSTICRLGMMDGNLPYVLPFNYGYKDKYLYIHCAKEGRKLEVLRKEPLVCFEIDQNVNIIPHEKACRWATMYRSIVGYGHVEIIDRYDEKEKGLAIIMQQHGFEKPIQFDPKEVESVFILKLKIDSLTAKQSGNWDRLVKVNIHNFESKRLLFNELSWDDLDILHNLHQIPEVAAFNTIGIPKSKAETRSILAKAINDNLNPVRSFIMWSVWTKDGNEFIGEAGLTLSNDRFKLGEIFYNIRPDYWNLGYGTEMAKSLINFGFDKFNLHKIEAGVATENSRSVHVLEKAGMRSEGVRRKILPIRGEWKDNYHYAILENEIGN